MILNISYPTQAPEQPKKGTDPTTDLIGNLYYIIYTFYTPTETFKCSFDDIIESDSLTVALKTYLQVTPWVPPPSSSASPLKASGRRLHPKEGDVRVQRNEGRRKTGK